MLLVVPAVSLFEGKLELNINFLRIFLTSNSYFRNSLKVKSTEKLAANLLTK